MCRNAKISSGQAGHYACLISYQKRKGGDQQVTCHPQSPLPMVISDSVISLSSVITDSVIPDSTLASKIFHISSYINFHFLVITGSVSSDSVMSISRNCLYQILLYESVLYQFPCLAYQILLYQIPSWLYQIRYI